MPKMESAHKLTFAAGFIGPAPRGIGAGEKRKHYRKVMTAGEGRELPAKIETRRPRPPREIATRFRTRQ